MLTLFLFILAFIFICQYIIIAAMLILNDQIPFIETRVELLIFLIPIIPIVILNSNHSHSSFYSSRYL